MIHFLLLPIGFGLGFFVAGCCAQWRLAEIEQVHAQELLAAKKRGFDLGRAATLHTSAAPFTSLN